MFQYSPNLWAVEKSSSIEGGAIIASVREVDLWGTARSIDHSHKGKLKHLVIL
jgi:hypothetical protein